MRWCSYNLVHWPLRTLRYIAYCYIHLLIRPSLPSFHPMSRLPRRLLPSCLQTGSSSQLGVICPCPSIPRNSVSSPLSPNTTRVQLFRPYLALTTPARFLLTPLPLNAKIFFSVAFIFRLRLSDATTARAPSPCHQTPHLLHKPRILVASTPTTLPSPDFSWCIHEETLSLLPVAPSPTPSFSKDQGWYIYQWGASWKVY